MLLGPNCTEFHQVKATNLPVSETLSDALDMCELNTNTSVKLVYRTNSYDHGTALINQPFHNQLVAPIYLELTANTYFGTTWSACMLLGGFGPAPMWINGVGSRQTVQASGVDIYRNAPKFERFQTVEWSTEPYCSNRKNLCIFRVQRGCNCVSSQPQSKLFQLGGFR